MGDFFTIRPILPRDNKPLEELIRAIFYEMDIPLVGTAFSDKSMSFLYENYQSPRATYFVVMQNYRVLGGVGIAPLPGEPSEVGELQKMYLRPEARGQGLAQALLEKCFHKAAEFGFRKLYLETHPKMKKAIDFYRRNGFEQLLSPLGCTGHDSCPIYMIKDLEV